MASVVLFHTVRGLRGAERALAARLTSAGHPTTVPDLYEGEGEDDIDAAFALHRRIGWETLFRRARRATEGLPPETVLAGISFGTAVAAALWPERPQTAGVLFLSGIYPWPAPLPQAPVALHLAEPDPFEAEEEVAGWIASGPAGLGVHRYPGAGHAFLDPTLPDFHADAAGACERRVLDFLDRL